MTVLSIPHEPKIKTLEAGLTQHRDLLAHALWYYTEEDNAEVHAIAARIYFNNELNLVLSLHYKLPYKML